MNLIQNKLPHVKDSSNEEINKFIWGYSIKWFIVLIWAIPWSVFMGIFLDFSSFYWGIMQYYYVILLVFVLTNKDYYFLPITYIVTGVCYILSLQGRWVTSTYVGFYKALSWAILNILFAIFILIFWTPKKYSNILKNQKERELPGNFYKYIRKNILICSGILSGICLVFLLFIYISATPISDESNYEINFSNKSFETIIRKELKIDTSSKIMRSDLDSIISISVTNSKKITLSKSYEFSPDKWSDDNLVFEFTSLFSCSGTEHNLASPITNLKDFRHFRKLKFLELVGDDNFVIYNLDDLRCLTSLETLKLTTSLYNKNSETNLEALNKLSNLKCLFLSVHNVTNFKCISDLYNLTVLRFNTESHLKNINDISSLTNLQYLSIVNCELSDISALSNLNNLVYISMFKNNIKDISVLENMSKLQYADLRYNKISEISVLGKLSELKYIVLLENENISDISSLTKLTKLKYLWIKTSDNYDLEILSDIKGLSIYTDSTD